jgi:hypothetical protein
MIERWFDWQVLPTDWEITSCHRHRLLLCLATQAQAYSAQADAASALSPKDWKALKLIKKEQLTHNTYRLR